MSLECDAALVLGESGPLREHLTRHLDALGARVLPEEPAPDEPVRFLFLVWAPRDAALTARPSAGWYEAAVVAPIRTAARLAPRLSHLCLVRTEERSVPAKVLEEALGFLARQRKIPFAVVRAPADQPSRLPEVAAFVAGAGLAGRIAVADRP